MKQHSNIQKTNLANAALAQLQHLPAREFVYSSALGNLFTFLSTKPAIWDEEPATVDGPGSKVGYHKGVFLESVLDTSKQESFVYVAYVSPGLYAQIAEAQKGKG